jgi:hypothetical protein
VAYTGSRHKRTVPVKNAVSASQARPDVNPHSIGAAAGVTLSPSTGVAAAGGTVITATVPRAAGGVRNVEVAGTNATGLTVLSDTQFTFVAPAKAAGARDVVISDQVGDVTKTGGLTYV